MGRVERTLLVALAGAGCFAVSATAAAQPSPFLRELATTIQVLTEPGITDNIPDRLREQLANVPPEHRELAARMLILFDSTAREDIHEQDVELAPTTLERRLLAEARAAGHVLPVQWRRPIDSPGNTCGHYALSMIMGYWSKRELSTAPAVQGPGGTIETAREHRIYGFHGMLYDDTITTLAGLYGYDLTIIKDQQDHIDDIRRAVRGGSPVVFGFAPDRNGGVTGAADRAAGRESPYRSFGHGADFHAGVVLGFHTAEDGTEYVVFTHNWRSAPFVATLADFRATLTGWGAYVAPPPAARHVPRNRVVPMLASGSNVPLHSATTPVAAAAPRLSANVAVGAGMARD